jgi:hypothetical protein
MSMIETNENECVALTLIKAKNIPHEAHQPFRCGIKHHKPTFI